MKLVRLRRRSLIPLPLLAILVVHSSAVGVSYRASTASLVDDRDHLTGFSDSAMLQVLRDDATS